MDNAMNGPLVFLVVVTILAYISGYHMDRSAFRRLGQACFFVGLGLVAFTGYFAWREHKTVSELARIVEPIPRITDVTYVPSPVELQAVARALAAAPGRTFTGNTQEERRATARKIENIHNRYWLFRTELRSEEVMNFYREPEHRQGWNVKTQTGSWIMLEGTVGSLTIFAADDLPSRGTRVIYIYDDT
jgi:hypothetical protein